jgi:dynein heavy chain
LKTFLDTTQREDIPFEALLFVTGEIHYGGRVTDEWDRLCLNSLLRKFYNMDIVEYDGYKFSRSQTYFVPYITGSPMMTDAKKKAPIPAAPKTPASTKVSPDKGKKDGSMGPTYVMGANAPPSEADLEQTHQYIDALPINDEPEVFGLHENAYITYLTLESNRLIETLLNLQPKEGAVPAGSGGKEVKSNDEIVLSISEDFVQALPAPFPKEQCQLVLEAAEGENGILVIVLVQEVERYNRLLDVMKTSLDNLQKAIKGIVVMSSELDNMYFALLNNILPRNWKARSFATLKFLASWFKDLTNRVAFFQAWLFGEMPKCFLLSAFYFPQGFLTGVLQTFARRYKKEIDKLRFKFKVLNQTFDAVTSAPKVFLSSAVSHSIRMVY